MTQVAEIDSQLVYNRQLFGALYDWDAFWAAALDLGGDREGTIRLALDQLGHLGPHAVALVAERLLAVADGPLTRVVELGSGFGGALRHLGRELRSRDLRPLLVGVEFVREHCELAAAIGRTTEDSEPLILPADAQSLPFQSTSIAAVFAVGSASRFSAMDKVLAECYRVLCPRGVLVMIEEVSLRPREGPEPGDSFLRHHPPHVFRTAWAEDRRAQLKASGLTVEAFEPLVDWAVPILRQRVRILQFLGHCANRMYGPDACRQIVGTLTSAADEYERGSIQPNIIVARRAQ